MVIKAVCLECCKNDTKGCKTWRLMSEMIKVTVQEMNF